MKQFASRGETPSATRNCFRFLTPVALLGAVGIAAVLSGGSASALAQEPQGAQGRPEMVDVLIGFTQTPGAQEEQLVRGQGGQVRRSFTLVPAVAATLPEPAIKVLSNDRRVTVIEPDGEFHAIDHQPTVTDEEIANELSNTWGVERIGAGLVHLGDEALALPANLGTGIGLAVFDSGLDYTHSEFHWNYAGGYDFHNGNSDPMDDKGHGTHVSGTATAARDGVGVVGAAPDVHLYALKMLGATGGGSFSSAIDALQWCVDHNKNLGTDGVPILVTNHSYGSGTHPGSIVEDAFDNAYAAGILHVAAAGNSGNKGGNNDTVGYPAAFGSVIAVAATDQNDKRPSWSSTGPAVELSAPGVSIYSSQLGGEYHTLNGTSMASPHVAGAAALAFSSSLDSESGLLTNVGARDVLTETALDLGNANRYGDGLVDAWAAALMASGGSSDDSNSEPSSDVLTVAAIDYAEHRNGKHLFIDVGVVNSAGVGVSDATVEIDVYLDDSLDEPLGGTTGADGVVSFRLSNAPSGYYSSVVVGASKEGWTWDGETPVNGYEKK